MKTSFSILLFIILLMNFKICAQNYYAVLIVGCKASESESESLEGPSGADQYWNDLFLMWEYLRDNGYSDEHIYILYGDGIDFNSDNQRYQKPEGVITITDFPSYKVNVSNIFTWLKDGNPEKNIPQVTDKDVLLVWTFDHGGKLSGNCNSTLQLMNEVMSDI